MKGDKKKLKKIPLFPLLLVNFIGTLGFSIVIPFLVFLVTRFGGNALIYGLLGAMYPAFQLIGAPILGRWSDTQGRKKILLLSQIGTAIAWLIFFIALFLPEISFLNVESKFLGMFIITLPLLTLFIARSLDGITGGNVSVANAYLADITSVKDRSRNFGKMAISSNLGFIIGPALAGVLGATLLGEIIPVAAALVISTAAIFVIIYFLPESKPCVIKSHLGENNIRKLFGHEHKECYKIKGEKKIRFKDILKMKDIRFIIALYFMIFLGFNIFYTAFPIHALQNLKWSVIQMGIFFSVMSGMMILVQGPILGRLSKIYSNSKLAIVGSLILGINFIFYLSSNFVLIYFGALLFALGNGIMWPSILSILSVSAGKKNQGSVQGYASSSGSLASIIGLIAGGVLYGFLGAKTFLVGSVIIFIVCIFSYRLIAIEKNK